MTAPYVIGTDRDGEDVLSDDRWGAREMKRIPGRLWDILDEFREPSPPKPPNESYQRALDMIGRFDWTFLFLAGPPGTGKTTLGALYLDRTLLGTGSETVGLFVTAHDLACASDFDAEFWRRCREVPRLTIDDLGVEKLDGAGRALGNIVQLFYSRHAEDRRTLVTTNLARSAFEERYCAHDGGRLRDRLREAGWWTELVGSSLRQPFTLDENQTSRPPAAPAPRPLKARNRNVLPIAAAGGKPRR